MNARAVSHDGVAGCIDAMLYPTRTYYGVRTVCRVGVESGVESPDFPRFELV